MRVDLIGVLPVVFGLRVPACCCGRRLVKRDGGFLLFHKHHLRGEIAPFEGVNLFSQADQFRRLGEHLYSVDNFGLALFAFEAQKDYMIRNGLL